jgi:hypothetical protein
MSLKKVDKRKIQDYLNYAKKGKMVKKSKMKKK